MRGNFPITLSTMRCCCWIPAGVTVLTHYLEGQRTLGLKVLQRFEWRQRTSHSPLRCTFPKTVRLLAKNVNNVAKDQHPFLSHNKFTKKKKKREIILCSLTLSYWLSRWTTTCSLQICHNWKEKEAKHSHGESHASVWRVGTRALRVPLKCLDTPSNVWSTLETFKNPRQEDNFDFTTNTEKWCHGI